MAVPTVDGLERLSDADLRRFRERVEALGYTAESLAQAASIAPGHLDAVALPRVRWELTRRGDAAGRLGLLFLCGDAVTPEAPDSLSPAPDCSGSTGMPAAGPGAEPNPRAQPPARLRSGPGRLHL